MTDVERQFGEAMFAIYRDPSEIGCTPSIFLRMLYEQGPVQTARLLINARQPSDGYMCIWEMERPDLSVETVVHDNAKWHSLFSQEELSKCKKRLVDYGVRGVDLPYFRFR